MVDGIRQVRKRHAGRGDLRFTRDIGELHDAIRVGDVERIADQLHAERGVQVLDENVLFPCAAAASLAQQGDLVAALGALARACGDHAGDQLLGGGYRLAAGALRFDHQDVVVGKYVKLARVLEAVGNFLDLHAVRHRGRLTLLPIDFLGHLHRRYKEILRLGQCRIVTRLLGRIEGCLAAATTQDGHDDQPQRAVTDNLIHGRDLPGLDVAWP